MSPPRLLRFDYGLFALCLLSATESRAETVTVPAAHDTTIYSNDSSSSNGAGDYVFAGVNAENEKRRALIAFDVARSVPPGSAITSATLVLSLTRTHPYSSLVEVHRLTAAWGEASSNGAGNEGDGAPAAEGDATWSYRMSPSVRWTTDGGDFDATPSATTTVDDAGRSYTWSSPSLTADVQAWLDDPTSNFGWILIAEQAGADTAKRFGSRDGSRGLRPALLVTFTPPASAIGACCADDATCGYVLDPGTSCVGTYQGARSSCEPQPCPPPTAACCAPDVSAACAVQTEAACTAAGGQWMEMHASCADDPCPVVLTPFVDELPLPAVATPTGTSSDGSASYRLAMVELQQRLHRDLPPTTVWGFDDGSHGPGYPGPTIEARTGVPVHVTWANDLRDATGALRTHHYLPVDTCVDGAETDAARTVIHLHGGHVPAESDGYPENAVLPGEEATYEYPNRQGAATLWYHDHAMGITRLNVIMGLAGFYILRDDAEETLGLPAGKYDIPLVIQDRSFHPDGTLKYPAAWQEHFFGDTILVNGKAWPYLHVDRGRYRFRMLNGSTSRTYKMSMSPQLPFVQIGSDGGLLSSGIATNWITLAPGERAELLLDFSAAAAGSEFGLMNVAPAPYPNGDPEHQIANVMKFVVTSNAGDTRLAPVFLRTIDRIDPSTAVVTRDFTLKLSTDNEACGGSAWRINGLDWHDITERPRLGTTEIWRFINRSGVAHPMHLHLVMFQVLDRQPFALDNDEVVPTETAMPPDPVEAGWKDTVLVGPFEIVRVIAHFEDYVGRFPYHCHMLEHEDHAMMRQFETLPACGDGGCPDTPAQSGSAGCSCDFESGAPAPGVIATACLLVCLARRGRRRTAAQARTMIASRASAASTLALAIVLIGCSSGGASTVTDAGPDAIDATDATDASQQGDGCTDADGCDPLLPFGATCTDDPQCATSICFQFGDGSQHCTQACTDSTSCPAGQQGSKCNGKGFCAY
jgi:spore coat protein A